MSWTLLSIILGYSMKALSHLFHSPSGAETQQRCSAEQQCSLPYRKYLFIQTGPLEREKATRGCTWSVGHQFAEPAEVWWGTQDQALISFPCGRLEKSGGGIWLWSHSLRKLVHSAPPLGMYLPLSTFNKPCIPTEAPPWTVFVVPATGDITCVSCAWYIWLRFNTLLYINNPVM